MLIAIKQLCPQRISEWHLLGTEHLVILCPFSYVSSSMMVHTKDIEQIIIQTPTMNWKVNLVAVSFCKIALQNSLYTVTRMTFLPPCSDLVALLIITLQWLPVIYRRGTDFLNETFKSLTNLMSTDSLCFILWSPGFTFTRYFPSHLQLLEQALYLCLHAIQMLPPRLGMFLPILVTWWISIHFSGVSSPLLWSLQG